MDAHVHQDTHEDDSTIQIPQTLTKYSKALEPINCYEITQLLLYSKENKINDCYPKP